jgi:intracellular multiplication protein IcmK
MTDRRTRTAFLAAAISVASASLFAQGAATQPAAAASQPAAAPQAKVPPLPGGALPPGQGMTPEAFSSLLNQHLPLTPGQVTEVKKATDAVDRARATRIGPSPQPVSVTARVTLAAGSNPHVLRLSPGIVTSVVFSDVTGAPWNVVKVVTGAKDALDIPKDPGAASNMFTISPGQNYIDTNLAIFLEGSPAPIMMAVVTNQQQVDFRVDVSVQARGPAAVNPVISRGLVDSVSAELTAMVAGVTPAHAKQLKIVSSDVPDVQAWALGQRMYVRARANVLSPPVPRDGKVATGADGTRVFELPLSPEVLLMAGGNVGRLRLSGFPPPGSMQAAAGAPTATATATATATVAR